jgi:Na+-transporting NADH:ubiquinone oxidoreductase subunit NqrC
VLVGFLEQPLVHQTVIFLLSLELLLLVVAVVVLAQTMRMIRVLPVLPAAARVDKHRQVLAAARLLRAALREEAISRQQTTVPAVVGVLGLLALMEHHPQAGLAVLGLQTQ